MKSERHDFEANSRKMQSFLGNLEDRVRRLERNCLVGVFLSTTLRGLFPKGYLYFVGEFVP